MKVDGRWLLNFGAGGDPDTGNELVLGDGKVAIARNGLSAGSYAIVDAMLVVTVKLPSPPGEGPVALVAKFLLPGPGEEALRLPGFIQAVVEGEPPRIAGPCLLVRRLADA